MNAHVWSIVVLFAVLLFGTARPVNLGALALIATFGMGIAVAHEDVDTIISGFPADIFLLLLGVTFLFATASLNGTIEWLVNSVARLVRNNRLLIPRALFSVPALPTTAGARGMSVWGFAVVVTAPVATALLFVLPALA